MRSITPSPLPAAALLDRYRREGAYTDCFATEMAGSISCARYVAAFYTTPVFRIERLILRVAIAKPSTDTQAREVADGAIDAFAAWTVEARTSDQLLMCDIYGRTRSWFMVEPGVRDDQPVTRLYFGSAVVPDARRGHEPASLPRGFNVLLGFHTLYSRVLLASARRRLAVPS